MPFKKGTSGNPIGRPKGSVSTTTKLIREHISNAIDGNKMSGLEDYLKSLRKPFNMFWVTEFTNYNYNTYNHQLVKGDIVDNINYHLKSKSLIGDYVKHLPYEEGASTYVSKYIYDGNWGIVNNNS